MTVVCVICNSAVTPTTPSVKCIKCKKYAHIKCLGLNETNAALNPEWSCQSCSFSHATSSNSNLFSLSDIEQLMERQFNKLKTELKQEFSQIINEKFKLIEQRIDAVENDVQRLTAEVDQISKLSVAKCDTSCEINDIVSEITERNERSKNVLLFNVPESKALLIEDKVKDDLNQVMSILNPIGSFPQPKKIFRLGAYKPNYRYTSFENCL